MSYLIKTIHAVFALIFLAFSALQLNDPDPLIWICFYLLCALVPGLALFNKPSKTLFWVAVIACVNAITIHAQGAYNYYLHMDQEPLMQSMNPQKPYIEEAREFLGSLLALGMVLISDWLAYRSLKKNK